MLEDLSLVKMASQLARHAGLRHRVISENVANADTPDFRARDVKKFTYNVNEEFMPRATRAAHGTGPAPGRPSGGDMVKLDLSQVSGPNGNSVSLESEMIKAVEARGRHALALAVYEKTHQFLRLGLGRRG